ncbi:hypothetical protein RB614_35560 [Phytohabitans sp. ZYX-F-186]|uniref:Uncharacterized protein n=1 Tax=Phytohabitans maris TaxID=3071409 RepID=A0ABU0ZS09_9ACTN|nr:hypothetical protein [Phytohabitans sp. ZYX-F-186]MDQ7909828.1 hypothetical protein [Phytohabitans sp. ZYX-F-186]
MLMHPDLVLAQANDRQRELIAEADRERLLATARRARRGRRARQEAPVRGQPTAAHAR